MLHQLAHDLRRLLPPPPQVLSIVVIARGSNALRSRAPHGLEGELRGSPADSRRHAAHVKPVGAIENGVPVKITTLGARDRRSTAIVGDLRWTLVGAGLEKIDAESLALPANTARVDAEAAKLAYACVADVGRRHGGHKRDRHAVLGQRHGDVCLSATERRLEYWGLKQSLESGRLEPEHHFAKRDALRHRSVPAALSRTTRIARSVSARMRSNCLPTIH